LNDPINLTDPEGKNVGVAIGLIGFGILVHDVYNSYHNKPTICGKVAEKLGFDLSDIPSIGNLLGDIGGF
jgi:hypothetical protein